MSATLPKIDALHEDLKGSFVSLIPNREQYFTVRILQAEFRSILHLQIKTNQKTKKKNEVTFLNCLFYV
jgi:hypothetical protein